MDIIIAFEGIDGSGLSTHSKLLASRLEERGVNTAVYKQPSRGIVGSLVRDLISREGYGGDLMGLLFTADRVHQFYYTGIVELLWRGVVLIFDRYKYSTLVYQSLSEPSPPREWLERVNEAVPPPHVLVFLDVPPEGAVRRIADRERRQGYRRQVYERRDFLEKAYTEFHRLLRDLEERPEYCSGNSGRPVWFLLLEKRGLDPDRFWRRNRCYPAIIRVPGVANGVERSIEDVARDVWMSVARYLE